MTDTPQLIPQSLPLAFLSASSFCSSLLPHYSFSPLFFSHVMLYLLSLPPFVPLLPPVSISCLPLSFLVLQMTPFSFSYVPLPPSLLPPKCVSFYFIFLHISYLYFLLPFFILSFLYCLLSWSSPSLFLLPPVLPLVTFIPQPFRIFIIM